MLTNLFYTTHIYIYIYIYIYIRIYARMPDETDAKQILTASPAGNWTRSLGRPRIKWMKTIQQDLKSSDLNMDDAVDLAQNRPLRRLISTFGATHS